jgi:tetratricopeptide (TPR) repeat protein/predicted Ser/Thr protein kinase
VESPGSADSTLVSADAVPVVDPERPRVPDAIGRYRVERLVGTGAMGVVFAARDPALDRRVAVKRMRDCEELAESERIQHEARSAAAVVHPNVVTIYDVGTDDGRVFVAMEYVEGESLTRWIRRPRRWRDALDVLVQAGRALAAAHAAGIVHRDFKPDNVLVDVEGRVKVVDFGLASALGDADPLAPATGPQPTVIDATSRWIGTPRYMAAERHEGARGDAKSDQFAFAVVAYECLFRVPPFAGVSVVEVAASICAGRIERPPRSRVPRAMQRVLLRGLARDPADRFPTMDAFVDALVTAAGARRRRLVGGLAAIVGLGVVAATVAATRDPACDGGEGHVHAAWDEATRGQLVDRWGPDADGHVPAAVVGIDGWVERWRQAHMQACEESRRGAVDADALDGRMACLQARLASVRAVVEVFVEHPVPSDSAASLVRDLDDPSTCVEEEAPVDPTRAAELAQLQADLARGRALWYLGLVAAADPIADEVLERAEALGVDEVWSSAAMLRANLWLSVRRIDEGRELAARVYDRALAQGDDRGMMDAIQVLATVALMQEDHRALMHWARLAEIQAARMAPTKPVWNAMIALMVAHAHRLAGDNATALPYLREALRIVEAEGMTGYIAVVTHAEISVTLTQLGRLDEAENEIDRAVGLAVLLPANSSDPLAIEQLHGQLFIARHVPHLAVTSLLLTRARLAELDQLDTEASLKVTCSLAGAYIELDAVAMARAESDACVAAHEPLGKDAPGRARALVRSGRIELMEAGEIDEGVARIERGLAVLELVRGADHPDVALALLARAEGAHQRGQLERAEADERRALEIYASHPSCTLGHVHALFAIGVAAFERGDLDRARVHLERARELASASEGAEGPDTLLAEAFLLATRVRAGEREASSAERAQELRAAIATLSGRRPDGARAALAGVLRD